MRRSKRKAIQNTAAAVPTVTISDLPNHVTCDILSRLPLNSIFACKRVCKTWRDLTLEAYFAKLHLSRPCRLNCEIFTIGIDDEWRSMGDTEQLPALIISRIIFLNGALYWIGVENLRFICYFDIEREHFRSFPLPSHIGKDCVHLEVVDNLLYLHNRHFLHIWRFWAMKDYGDFGSWALEWVIEEPTINKFEGFVRPLKTLKDGRLLMTFYNFTDATKTIIASYNPRTRVLKKNKYHLSGCWCTAVADIPCFFSPMDALK
ncbi:hypothetical protein RHMOL_Rhmol04G0066400 [Rhododendron molle]|uniref:Uncharacterized protein n=1 Tax=Rhododendron molle TaxID=49168 RepID=A0ACC0NZ14_RHOML|nr:hypothetical protein RHMOL_Rhmol04G0066400 [Rhododendron molle]